MWSPARRVCRDLISATVPDITSLSQSVYSDKYVFYVSEVSNHAHSAKNRISTGTNLQDDDVWLHHLDNQRWIGYIIMCTEGHGVSTYGTPYLVYQGLPEYKP
jgi:hypothetical protein